MENAIVTGANGFIGKTLVNALLEKGYHVMALDIRFDDVLANDNRVTCVNVMNKEVAALAEEIPHQEYRCFFHLAWQKMQVLRAFAIGITGLETEKWFCNVLLRRL